MNTLKDDLTILLPGDILFTRAPTWLSKAIRFCTRTIGESKSVASHVGIITEGGFLWHAILVEAQAHTNRHTLGEGYGSKPDELCIFRPLNLTQEDLNAIAQKAETYVGRDYGYLKLGLHLLDWCIGGKYFFRRLGRLDNYPICSYVVSSAYKVRGKSFGIANFGASPDDMWDFCITHPDKYQFIWQRGTMYGS